MPSYDEWRTNAPDLAVVYCDLCEGREAVTERWIDDDEPGMVRRVDLCAICDKQFQAASGEGSSTQAA